MKSQKIKKIYGDPKSYFALKMQENWLSVNQNLMQP